MKKSYFLLVALIVSTVQACFGQEHQPAVFSEDNKIERLPPTTTSYRARNLADDNISSLSRFKGLVTLDFSAGLAVQPPKITDKGLAEIAKLDLPDLKRLSLGWNDEITDEGLAHLPRIKTLIWLGLPSCTKITDAGLRRLAQLEGPVGLDLRACPNLTDEGIQQLAAKKDWEEIVLDGCPKITPEGLARLKARLPNVTIAKIDENWQHMGPDSTSPKWRKR